MTDRKAAERYTPLPRNAKNRVDKKLIRELYLASKHVEWEPFCHEQSWNPALARMWCPTRKWVEEKRQSVEETIASDLRALQLEHRRSWVSDVRTTLKQYPLAVDNVMFLVQKWIALENAKGPTSSPPTGQLLSIAETVKKCIDAKKSILMISDAVVAMTPPDPEAPKEGAGEWTMEIRGMKKPSVRDVQELLERYVDKPLRSPADFPADLSADDVAQDAGADDAEA